MDFLNRVPAEVIYVTVAAIGGTARYLQNYLNEGDFTLRHFAAHVFVSAFSGYMFYQFAINVLGLPEQSIAVISGLGGWMGVEAIKVLEIYLKKRFKETK